MTEKNNSESKLPDGDVRYTVIINKKDLNRVLDYAYTERITVKEAFSEIIDSYFKEHKKKLLPSPKRK